MTTGICFTDPYDLQNSEENPAELDVNIINGAEGIEGVMFWVKSTDKTIEESCEVWLSLDDVADLVSFLNQRALGNE
jgi:hypothetical protein